MKTSIKLIVLILVINISTLFSQNKKFVGLELAGSYGLSGISYDSRFDEKSKFGYKIGIGYGFEKNSGVSHWYFTPVKAYFPEDDQMCNYFSVPMNIHYLFGQEKHFFETALGLNLFVTDYNFRNYNRIGYFSFCRIAYRYESKNKPVLFSIGIDMPFKTPGCGLGYSLGFIPSISIGYKL